MMDIMFYEVFEEEERLLKRYLPRTIKASFTKKTIQEVTHQRPPSVLISIRTQSLIPNNWAPQLSGVFSRSQGFDHLERFSRKAGGRIAYGSLIDYCSRAVAEHAMMVTMALLRKLKKQLGQFGNFNRDQLSGRECRSSNLLVVGVGAIGLQVVDIAKGLKMNVKGVDIKKKTGVSYISLKEGVAWADAIVCCLALTDRTDGLLNYALLKKVKRGTVLVNISRGEITPLTDVKRLLDEGILGGLSLDVYPNEKEIAGALRRAGSSKAIKLLCTLKKHDNVLFTPHNAFNTLEATDEKAKQTVEALQHFIKRGKFPKQNTVAIHRRY